MRGCALLLVLCGCDEVFSIDEVPALPPRMTCAADFCIDITEVSITKYAAFVAESPTAQHAACAGNDIVPPSWSPAPGDERPVVNVDWCDAWAYCAWQGKRLCGKIGGGPLAPSDRNNVMRDEWHHACTGGNAGQTYPYGTEYVAGLCNDSDTPLGPVGTYLGCEGGLPGLFDMSGSVWEWVDACDAAGPDAQCDTRGGAYYEPSQQVTCGTFTSLEKFRATHRAHFLGFRCCRDL